MKLLNRKTGVENKGDLETINCPECGKALIKSLVIKRKYVCYECV